MEDLRWEGGKDLPGSIHIISFNSLEPKPPEIHLIVSQSQFSFKNKSLWRNTESHTDACVRSLKQ